MKSICSCSHIAGYSVAVRIHNLQCQLHGQSGLDQANKEYEAARAEFQASVGRDPLETTAKLFAALMRAKKKYLTTKYGAW